MLKIIRLISCIYSTHILYLMVSIFLIFSGEIVTFVSVWSLTTLVLVKVVKVDFPFPLSVHHVAEELFIIQQAIFVFVIRINDILGGKKTSISRFVVITWMHECMNGWMDEQPGTLNKHNQTITWTFPSVERIPCFLISLWSSATDMKPSLFWSSLTNKPRNWSMVRLKIQTRRLFHLLAGALKERVNVLIIIRDLWPAALHWRWLIGSTQSQCSKSSLPLQYSRWRCTCRRSDHSPNQHQHQHHRQQPSACLLLCLCFQRLTGNLTI